MVREETQSIQLFAGPAPDDLSIVRNPNVRPEEDRKGLTSLIQQTRRGEHAQPIKS